MGGITVLLCLAAVLLPAFLDRVYYRGRVSDHFDGQRFYNPDGDDDRTVTQGRGGRIGFFWRQLTGSDGRPRWPDRVEVVRTIPPARVEGARMLVTWIGHATVLVQTNGLNILTDPVYSERAGPLGFGPKRVAEPGVRFEDLPRIDLVLVSHNHYDHMDLPTLKRLWERDRPVIVTSLGNDNLIESIGIPNRARTTDCGRCPGVQALDWGEDAIIMAGSSEELGQGERYARVSVMRGHHWGSRWFADRNRALWSSFVIDTPKGGSVFFAGDTGFGDGQWPQEAKRQALGPIRLALIPIGAFRFEPGQMASGSHIGPVQAVEVFKRLGARYAIPIHWGTFRLSYEGYDTPPRLLDRVTLCRRVSDFTAYPVGTAIDVPPIDAPRVRLPRYGTPPSCRQRPFAPDLK